MDVIKCPYCHSRVRVSDVDADGGECPECGAPLMGSSLFAPDLDEDDIYGDDFGDDVEGRSRDENFDNNNGY